MQASDVVTVSFVGRESNVGVQLLGACWNHASRLSAGWIAGPAMAISGIASEISLVSDKRVPAINRPGNPDLRFSEEAYVLQKVRLPAFNTWQLLFRAARPTLIIGDIDTAMRNHLMSGHFTTPMLPEWVPWIVQETINRGKLKPLNEFGGMEAYDCLLETEQLDGIVSEGLAQGTLRVE